MPLISPITCLLICSCSELTVSQLQGLVVALSRLRTLAQKGLAYQIAFASTVWPDVATGISDFSGDESSVERACCQGSSAWQALVQTGKDER